MTMNDSWGYHKADDDWKTPKKIVRNLATCAQEGGNYLLNIGPLADGSIPPESVKILSDVGKWMAKNSETMYGAERCGVKRGVYAEFTRKGNTLYVHVYFWPGDTVTVAGLTTKVKSAKLLPRASRSSSSRMICACSSPGCRRSLRIAGERDCGRVRIGSGAGYRGSCSDRARAGRRGGKQLRPGFR